VETADAVLDALKQIVPGLAATLGRSCEVVLHDYRRGEQSVVAVSGQVAGRHVGSATSEIGLRMLARGAEASEELNHVTRTDSGRTIKSSTMPLRDHEGRLYGALCVNLDVTALRQVSDMLGDLAGVAPATATTTFADEFDEIVEAVVRAEELSLAKPVDSLTRQERLPLLKALDTRGVYTVRGAAPKVAARLGISRASLYSDLAECRR
jgi:predicted transcriptional regulator YheO